METARLVGTAAATQSLDAPGGVSIRWESEGPRFRTAFGFLAVMRRDPLWFFSECFRRYGDVVPVRLPPWNSFFFFHPRDVRRILLENHHNYGKGVVFQKLKRLGGEGLIFSDGALWRRQRQLIQPAFHRDRIGGLAEMMTETTAAMLESWERYGANGRVIDVAEEMSELTLEIVARAMFGTDLGTDKPAFCDAVTRALAYANHLVNHMFAPPLFVPTPANVRGRRALSDIDRLVWKVISARRRDSGGRTDLLAMLINARDAETNEAMNDQQLRDEMVTFLIAGHETTAVALSWTWHLLSEHPLVESRLHRELDAVLGGRTPTLDDLGALQYTRMVLDEAMRLYPPVWGLARQTAGVDEIGGRAVPAGTVVSFSAYVTHRHPAFWPDPERFDPERFSSERSEGRPEFAYFPFGGGPRGCVGKQFALLEGRLILAMVAQRFRLARVAGHPVEAHPILSLRPRHGLKMSLVPRSG